MLKDAIDNEINETNHHFLYLLMSWIVQVTYPSFKMVACIFIYNHIYIYVFFPGIHREEMFF